MDVNDAPAASNKLINRTGADLRLVEHHFWDAIKRNTTVLSDEVDDLFVLLRVGFGLWAVDWE